MPARVNQWKLGLFVLLVAGAAVVAAVAIGECGSHHATQAFHTYFDESVAGLSSGGRVTFRGVDVGSISRIAIASDHRHVEVRYDLDVAALGTIGITGKSPDHGGRYEVPPDLRAQIGGNGLTGVKSLAIDVFDPRENPPPALPFPAGPDTIPAATSTMKSLEDALTKAAAQFPELSEKAAATLAHADAAVGALEEALRRFDRQRVPERTAKTLDDARAAIGRLDGLLGSTRDVDQTLDELRDAADAIRTLAEDIDRDPDMLLKGRARSRPR